MDYDNQVVKIKVFGIGGAGCNAVARMVSDGLQGAEFYVCNTDLQCLNQSPCTNRIILGKSTTSGLGAGANPEVGRKAAEESESEIKQAMQGANMIFITAGMGGGTGTGAAPVFARIAKELGALTVGVVTKPFDFEGRKRNEHALVGLDNLKANVDSLIIISNDQLMQTIGDSPVQEAFEEADSVLRQGVQTISDLVSVPAFINLDFADIKTVMENKGTALIGIGMAQGDNKAQEAAAKAIRSPLLEAKITGAKDAIINITGGPTMTLIQGKAAVEYITQAIGNEVDIIYGFAQNDNLGDNMIVTVIATGFDSPSNSIKYNTNTVFTNQSKSNESVTFESNNEDNSIPVFFKNR